MKTITEHITTKPFSSAPFNQYFKDLRMGVFDIETTGLSPAGSRLILSGFLIPDEDGLLLTQFFAESLADEEEVILATLGVLDTLDVVVTYNGKSFDIPFLDVRAKRVLTHNAAYKQDRLPYPYNLDLYTVVRKFSPLRQYLPNLKQKTLEDFLGLIPGNMSWAFEFRSPSWFDGEILGILRKKGCSLCIADTDEDPATEIINTATWGYLRLRRSDYTDAALSQWIGRILSQKWERAFVFFKHEDEAKGPEMAIRFRELIESRVKRRTGRIMK